MELNLLIEGFVMAAKGIQYWYLTNRIGRYNISVSRYKEFNVLYGEMYYNLVNNYDTVHQTTINMIAVETRKDVKVALKDFLVTIETRNKFNPADNLPQKTKDEINAISKNVIEANGYTNINQYLVANNILVSRNFYDLCILSDVMIDESNIFVPIPASEKIDIYFQTYGTQNSYPTNIPGHPIFARKNVGLYFGCSVHQGFDRPPGYPEPNYPNSDPMFSGLASWATPESQAVKAVWWVEFWINKWNTERPGVPFKWAMWNGGWGQGIIGNQSLTKNPLDYVQGYSQTGVWHENGIIYWKKYGEYYFAKLKEELDARGFPYPDFIDPDFEEGAVFIDQIGTPPGFGQNYTSAHQVLINDPRANTVLIDGIYTYADFCNFYTGMDGSHPPELIPSAYNRSPANINHTDFLNCIGMRILSYVLDETMAKPYKAVFGNVIPWGNWIQYAANRDNPTFMVRPSETNHLFNTDDASFRADYQVYSQYGLSWYNDNNLSTIPKIKTFDTMCSLFGVNPSSSTVYMDLLMNELEYNFTCMKNAAPTKPIVHWNQAVGMIGGATNSKFPVAGSLIVDKDYYKNVLLKCMQHNIKRIGMFEEWRNPQLDMIEQSLQDMDNVF